MQEECLQVGLTSIILEIALKRIADIHRKQYLRVGLTSIILEISFQCLWVGLTSTILEIASSFVSHIKHIAEATNMDLFHL